NTLTNGIGVYLEDRSNNTFTMLNTNDYVFTADSNLSGVGRFYLRFDTSALGLDQNGFESLVVYATLTPKQIVINGLLSETTKATVYDVRGRQMMAMPLIENVARQVIDINNLSSGFYVLKIQGKNGVLSQKIVVK
ncbi:MAG TPA: T9SS type A sorting domain-containing protein, partial [Aquaticitalea sp.]|nr:T9SS type A sorting domain-containing protein [Aquaticitalea sp.]